MRGNVCVKKKTATKNNIDGDFLFLPIYFRLDNFIIIIDMAITTTTATTTTLIIEY